MAEDRSRPILVVAQKLVEYFRLIMLRPNWLIVQSLTWPEQFTLSTGCHPWFR